MDHNIIVPRKRLALLLNYLKRLWSKLKAIRPSSIFKPIQSRSQQDAQIHQLVITVFNYLRQSGFQLGINELKDALRIVEHGWGKESLETLKQLISMLWCNEFIEMSEFDIIWNNMLSLSKQPEKKLGKEQPIATEQNIRNTTSERFPSWIESKSPIVDFTLNFGMLPIPTPSTPLLFDKSQELNSYWPLSRREMVYAWRYLRRPITDGPADVLDLEATIAEIANQGFFTAPIYRRRETNYAHLLLLLDQGGSMVPFQKFSRDIVVTAKENSNIEHVDVFYFYNVPVDTVYLNPHRTTPIDFKRVLSQCTRDTSILIISDAGAARGYRQKERIRATTQFLSNLRARTPLIAWLNPMPESRWPGSSAQIITHMVPMFHMDVDGFSNAIDIVRGQ